MKLEDQVVSLELAQKLAGLGVERESYFIHAEYQGCGVVKYGIEPSFQSGTGFPAYTVAEIGEMLPAYLTGKGGTTYHLELVRYYGEWQSWYENEFGDSFDKGSFANESMVGALSIMLIHLIENGHVSVEELNRG